METIRLIEKPEGHWNDGEYHPSTVGWKLFLQKDGKSRQWGAWSERWSRSEAIAAAESFIAEKKTDGYAVVEYGKSSEI